MARAQDSVRIAVASLCYFVVALFLTAYSAKNPTMAQLGGTLVSELLYPLQLASTYVSSSVANGWNGYIALRGVRDENVRLHDRLGALESQNIRLMEVAHENARLRQILNMKQEQGVDGMVAAVIGYDPVNWVQTVTIDKGSADGMRESLAVLDVHANVVGQLIAVGLHSSRVLLLTDPVSGIDAVVQDSRARGVVEGLGGSLARLSFVQRDLTVQIGERVLTSGMDGVFPRGRLIGTVVGVKENRNGLFQLLQVRPAAPITTLEYVFVLTSGAPVIDAKVQPKGAQ